MNPERPEHSSFTTTTVIARTTTEKTIYYSSEHPYSTQRRISSITVPVVSAVILLIFCIAIFGFVVHVRKRRSRIERDRVLLEARRMMMRQQRTGDDSSMISITAVSTSRMFDDLEMGRIKDLPPPYPGPVVAPPSYEVACGIVNNGNSCAENHDTDNCRNYNDDSTRYEGDYNSSDTRSQSNMNQSLNNREEFV